MNESISDLADVTYGVRQGSILGPLFFIMYVNDVITTFDQHSPNIILYADDTAIYYAHEQLEVLEEKLTLGLNKLSDWCNLNKLSINFDKTKLEIFRPKSARTENPKIVIKVGDAHLEEVLSCNYLGVIIDKMLFDRFLKEKCNKINVRLYQLGKLRKFITPDSANIVYKQTIVLLFDYADFLIESG